MLTFIKMNKDLERVIEIPEGVEVVVSGNDFVVKAPLDTKDQTGQGRKELKRSVNIGKVSVVVSDKKIIMTAKGATRRESKMIGTVWAHLKNMIKGVGEDFTYELEVCNVHFPMSVKVDGERIVVKSFLGETTERVARIMPNTKVDISGSKITVTSHDIEAAGQTAANLEKATRLIGRDRRIFQDGIYITKKPYRVI